MKVYYDKQWFIERDDGTLIGLSWNESSMIFTQMIRARFWDEVAMRFEDHPQWKEICGAKDDILDDLVDVMEPTDDEYGDAVRYIVERWVDLEDDENDL